MFVLSNFLVGFAKILDMALTIYFWIIVIRALISWVNPDPYNPIVRFLYQVTEPVLYRIRKVVPYMGGLDLSPLIVIFIIYFFQWAVIPSIIEFALRLKTGGGI
ncbi:MAG: YggT family protein [Deltaproteobacteria bacterium]|nr:YggT family protein [Deltaproteobacteria bacterium]